MSKRIISGMAAAAMATATVLAVAPGAQAASNGDWSAVPERADSGPQATPRQYFFFDLAAGGTVKDVVTISNSKKTPLALSLYPADAVNVRAGGGFGVTAPSATPTDIGTWLKLSKTQVVVPPASMKYSKLAKKKVLTDGSVKVPFTMTAPDAATPGDHVGGIVTIEPEPGQVDRSSGAAIGIQRSLTVRVYARISGPLNPQLLVSNVRLSKVKPATMPFLGSQGSAVLEYTYVNNGNVRITPTATITYKGLLGRSVHASSTAPSPEILPGGTITLAETVTGMPLLDRVTARVEMSGEGANDQSVQELSTAGETVTWSISWIFVAVLAVVAIVVGLWVRRRKNAGSIRSVREPQVRGKRGRPSDSEAARL